MFARLVVAFLLGFSSLMLVHAAAQPKQRPSAPVSTPPPAAMPHVSAPPRIAAPPPIASPRIAAPPHVAIQPHFAPPPHIAAPSHVAGPPSVAPLHVTVPHAAPRVASPRLPSVAPRAPASSERLQSREPGQASALNRTQAHQLRSEESAQIRQLRAQQRQHLRDMRAQGQRPDGNTLRQLRAQNEQQVHDLRMQFRERREGLQNLPSQVGALRPNGNPRITPESAREGRFASRFLQRADFSRWRVDRIAPHLAWRRHHRAAFVVWTGPVFWPYVYVDLFYYPFWPEAYDDGYWAYAYDDFFDSIYWATGNPYAAYTYAAPTAESVGQVFSARNKRQVSGSTIDICESNSAITAWPFEKIASLLKPSAQQQTFLDELKAAAAEGANELKASCPHLAALTPTGRLQAMFDRLQSTLDAARTVRTPLVKFYDSLTDEQKARFNAIGPNVGQKGGTAELQDANMCSGRKPGLTDLPIERIEDAVHPTKMQEAAIDRLSKANGQAIAILQAACPNTVPQTPVGRLDAIEKRLDAMIQAAKAIQPALQELYGSLTDEQKSRFNVLGQQALR